MDAYETKVSNGDICVACGNEIDSPPPGISRECGDCTYSKESIR